MAKSCLEEEEQNEFDRLLNSHDLRRALRIQAWIRRFTTHRDRKGPLTSEDLREVRDWWIRRVQNLDSKKPQFTQTKNALNLILEQHHPPDQCLVTVPLVEQHLKS